MKNKLHLICFSYLFLLFFTSLPKQARSFQKNNLDNKSNYLISNVPVEEKLIKTITANGFGTSIESAARNAASNALTQIVGSFIDSETIIKEKTTINNGILEQSNIIKEEISDYSQGSIKYFEILNIEKNDSIYNVTARVDVRVDDFKKYIKKVANNISRISTTELFAEMGTKQNNLDNKYQFFRKIFLPLKNAEVMKTSKISEKDVLTLNSFISSGKCKNKSKLFFRSDLYCDPDESHFSYAVDLEKSIIFPFSITLDQNYIDNTLDILENISDFKNTSTFTFNTENPLDRAIRGKLFKKNLGIVINKTNTKLTSTTGYILDDIKQRFDEDKKLNLRNYNDAALHKKLRIDILDAKGNILFFFKENCNSKVNSSSRLLSPVAFSGSSKNILLYVNQNAYEVSRCPGQMYKSIMVDYLYGDNLFKITTKKDFYFAFEVNDFDKFRKAEIIQITYE